MNRYYILTKRDGVKVVEASAVDEFDPFTIRFVADSGASSFDRQELLWWSPVLSSPSAPFSHFDSLTPVHPHHSLGGHLPRKAHCPNSPWEGHGAWMHEAQRKPDFHELSGAAMDALIAAVRPRVPREWRNALLELKVVYQLPANRYEVSHRLLNPDTGAEAMDFSDELFATIEVYHRIYAEGGQNWNQSTLTLHRDQKGSLTAQAKYSYGKNFGPR